MEFPFTDLLHSNWHDYRKSGPAEDRLDDPEWMKNFLDTWELPSDAPSAGQIAELKSLRAVIGDIVRDNAAGRAPSEKDMERLKGYIENSKLQYAFKAGPGEYKLDVVPQKRDWNWVLNRVALSFAEVLASDNLKSVKMCENKDCRWVFYDETKNRSRRWCDTTCGNLIKVREFRKRRKNANTEDQG